MANTLVEPGYFLSDKFPLNYVHKKNINFDFKMW